VDLAQPERTANAFAPVLDETLASPENPGAAAFALDHYSWREVARRYDQALRNL
jgi:hypothetical protein